MSPRQDCPNLPSPARHKAAWERLDSGAAEHIAYFPLHAVDAKALIKLADEAMYTAKAAGGNSWRAA